MLARHGALTRRARTTIGHSPRSKESLTVSSAAPPSFLPAFESMGLPRKVLAALVLEDIETPTPVQEVVIPDAMAGHDVLGRARTGSGKTLAFGIPIVARLAGRGQPLQAPARPRHRADARARHAGRALARARRARHEAVAHHGVRRHPLRQADRPAAPRRPTSSSRRPGRLQDLIDKGYLRTDDVQLTVLDEADHLCDLGFYPAVDALLEQTPEGGQRLLLSATLDGDVDALVRKHLRDPRRHEVDPNAGSVTTMEHHVLTVGGFRDKVAAAVALVEANPRAIVFTRTREGAMELRDALGEAGITAVDLHGNLTQKVRERNLERFSTGRADAVVATDVAARGIHVDNVGMVIHFDPPSDAKAYLHRSGRTARAGESGAVVTIATPRQLDTIVSQQRDAGVTSRYHDIRTTPRPMHALVLAESGTTEAPARSSRGTSSPNGRKPYGSKSYGSKSYGSKSYGSKPHRSQGDHPSRRTTGGGRPDSRGVKPAGSTKTFGKPAGTRPSGKKARWTAADKAARDTRS